MTHHSHYIPTNLDPVVSRAVNSGEIDSPEFIGQGATKHIGSDCYGFYIVSRQVIGKKVVWGLVPAYAEFHNDWTDGCMDCCLPGGATRPEDCEADRWVVQVGEDTSGRPKLWFCSKDGVKFNGQKCTYCWNGCAEYRDPSF